MRCIEHYLKLKYFKIQERFAESEAARQKAQDSQEKAAKSKQNLETLLALIEKLKSEKLVQMLAEGEAAAKDFNDCKNPGGCLKVSGQNFKFLHIHFSILNQHIYMIYMNKDNIALPPSVDLLTPGRSRNLKPYARERRHA